MNTTTVIFEFTEEEDDALHGFIPMTQELFNSCMDKCVRLGSRVEKTFYKLINTYPDFLNNSHPTIMPKEHIQSDSEY